MIYEATAREICERTWRALEAYGEHHLPGVVDAAAQRAAAVDMQVAAERGVRDFIQPHSREWHIWRDHYGATLQAMSNVFRAYRIRT